MGCLAVVLLGFVVVIGLAVALRPEDTPAPPAPAVAAVQAVPQDLAPRGIPQVVPAKAPEPPPPAPRAETSAPLRLLA